MKRALIFAALVGAILAAMAAGASPVAAAQTCSNSWGSDGHPGPWYVGSNQSLHGNTLVITCPSGGVGWSVHYQVIKWNPNNITQTGTPIDETRSGSGSTSFSISVNPVGCNPGWDYETHVHNIVTGGNITKPGPSGTGVVIC